MLWCLSNCQSAHSSLSIISEHHNTQSQARHNTALTVVHRRAGSWLQSVKTNLVLGILTVLFKNTIYISFGQMGPKIDICPAWPQWSGRVPAVPARYFVPSWQITLTMRELPRRDYHNNRYILVIISSRHCQKCKLQRTLLCFQNWNSFTQIKVPIRKWTRFILFEIQYFALIKVFKVLKGLQRIL